MFGLLCAGVLAVSSPRPAPEPAAVRATPPTLIRAAHDPVGVVEFELDNGFRVLLAEVHDQAKVFGAVVVDVGSKDDPADNTGLAHYLEHMLFKGTQRLGTIDFEAEQPHLERIAALYEELREHPERRAALLAAIDREAQQAGRYAIPRELDRLLSRMGGDQINAFTHPDYTVYHNELPASQVEPWLLVQAHRFRNPVFRLFPSELEAVYEEKNRAMNGFFRAAYQAFTRAFFPDHPYGTQSGLGSVEHLKRPSIAAMRSFYEQYYVANNMALVLVGDFNVETVAPMVEAAFATLPKGSEPPATPGKVEPFRGPSKSTVRVTPVRAGALGFRTPRRGHPDDAASDVLVHMLSNEQRSGAIDALADGNELLAALSFNLEFHDANGLIIAYVPRLLTQSFAGAERNIERVLRGFRERPVDASTLAAIRDNLLRDAKLEWEDPERLALRLVDLFARDQRWPQHLAYLQRLEQLEPRDVQRVAKTYFGRDRMVLRSRMGQPERQRLQKPGMTPVEPRRGARSEYYRTTVAGLPSDVHARWVDFEADIRQHSVAELLRLESNRNPVNGIATLEVRFGLGRVDDPALEQLAALLPRSGTEQSPSTAFKQRLFDLATTLEVEATAEAFVLRLQGPERNLGEALDLVDELVHQPARRRGDLRRLRRENWATERVYRGEARTVAEALFEHVVYGNESRIHRYGHRATRRMSMNELMASWARVQQRAVTIRYVGTQTNDAIAALVAEHLDLALERPAVPPRFRTPVDVAGPKVVFVKRRKAVQTNIYTFVPSDPVPLAERPVMDAFDEYFGDLVFQEVRELRALAYAAGGGFVEPSHEGLPGFTYAYVGCQADKTEQTLDVLAMLLTRLPQRPARVDAVVDALRHRQELAGPSFRQLQATVERWRWQGYVSDPRQARVDAYPQLDFRDIDEFWHRYVAGRPLVLMVVGDPRQVDHTLLERFGPVETVSARRLYAPNR